MCLRKYVHIYCQIYGQIYKEIYVQICGAQKDLGLDATVTNPPALQAALNRCLYTGRIFSRNDQQLHLEPGFGELPNHQIRSGALDDRCMHITTALRYFQVPDHADVDRNLLDAVNQFTIAEIMQPIGFYIILNRVRKMIQLRYFTELVQGD